jgi:quercetin dioxygenase-like cupin family protein
MFPMAMIVNEPQQRPAERGKSVWYMGNLMTFHATSADTDGRFALIEVLGTPGNEPPPHVHEREDELFYILEGEMDFFCGGRAMPARAGDSVLLPRGIAHTFRVRSEYARGLVYISPGGLEGYFQALSEPAEYVDMPASMWICRHGRGR